MFTLFPLVVKAQLKKRLIVMEEYLLNFVLDFYTKK